MMAMERERERGSDREYGEREGVTVVMEEREGRWQLV